jgi:hypothetical protein
MLLAKYWGVSSDIHRKNSPSFDFRRRDNWLQN